MGGQIYDDVALARSFSFFLEDLRKLVDIQTLFYDDAGIRRGLRYCAERFGEILPLWTCGFDAAGNLNCVPRDLETSRPIVYLSAHIDTVGVEGARWLSSPDPFRAIDTGSHIVGRGANDCKAGVAFMLLVAELIRVSGLERSNVGFLVSYREEGNQAKSSVQIGKDLGSVLPLSTDWTYIFCLENTVSVETTPFRMAMYDCEPCNVFIEITGFFGELRRALGDFPDWKPVCIAPVGGLDLPNDGVVVEGAPGHSATVPNAQNVIYREILAGVDDLDIVVAGDSSQTSVIPQYARRLRSHRPVLHRLVLNFRGLWDIERVKGSLEGVSYREFFPFEFGAGSDRRKTLEASGLKAQLSALESEGLKFTIEPNPGRSDASAIWNNLDVRRRERIAIATIGPGTRTHVDEGIRRATHGPDEGFHKASGRLAVEALVRLVSGLAGRAA